MKKLPTFPTYIGRGKNRRPNFLSAKGRAISKKQHPSPMLDAFEKILIRIFTHQDPKETLRLVSEVKKISSEIKDQAAISSLKAYARLAKRQLRRNYNT